MPALVILDGDDQVATIRAALGAAGCADIVRAPTIDDAVTELARDRTPELIVVDISPRDRRAIADLARLARKARSVPIVAIAADELLAATLAAGAADAIAKPLRPGDVRVRLGVALRAHAEHAKRASRERRLSDSMARLQRENHDLERLVCVDSLTGIANRRHALALLDAECKRAARDRAPLSLVMIDLDYFHAFNERYGHRGGDGCLQRVVETMVLCLRRPSDFLGRYGGEEFVAVLPNTNAIGARIVAERLRAAVETSAIAHAASQRAPVVTISAGFATWSGRGERCGAELVAAADAALLRAKLAGRNCTIGEAPASARAQHATAYPWARFAPVIADPWFADRVPGFLAATRSEIAQIANGASDHAPLVARRLKARAADYGFDQLRRLAGDLEHAVRLVDGVATRDIAAEIVEYVEHVQVVYRRPIESEIAMEAEP